MTNQETLTQLLKRAEASYHAGRYSEAAGLFEQASRQYAENGDALRAAEMQNNRSVALVKSGDGAGALEAAQGTDQVFAQAGDLRKQALALGNQAAAHEAVNDLETALERYKQSAELLKQCGDEESRVPVLKAISALQIRTGHQFEALASMDAALNNQKKLGLLERVLKKLLDIPMRMMRRG